MGQQRVRNWEVMICFEHETENTPPPQKKNMAVSATNSFISFNNSIPALNTLYF